MNRATRLVFCLAALLVPALFLATQQSSAANDWQPIPPEDLALKDNPKSPGSDAMILYHETEIRAGESLSEYVRIKVFTERGAKRGDISIPFQKSLSDIRDIRARTIRPNGEIANFEGNVLEKVVMKINAFEIDAKTFSLPQVEPGCIIEYRYVQQLDRARYSSLTWNVQGDLYTRSARFTTRPPHESQRALYYRQWGLPEGVAPQHLNDGSYVLEVHDLPGVEKEELMLPDSVVRARVEFFYRSPSEPLNESPEQFWARTGKQWGEFLDKFMNKNNVLIPEVARIVNPEDPPETKLRKIYARVEQIRNLSYENSKTLKERKQENLKINLNVEDVLKHGYGTSRDINLLFVGMARAAGFDSTTMFVAPRNRNFFQPELQDTRQLSVEIVGVQAGSNEYYLDPGGRYFSFGVLPWYATQTKGIRVGSGTMVSTPLPPSSEATRVRHADLAMDGEGTLTGKLRVEYTGQWGAGRRENYREEDEAGRQKKLTDEISAGLPPGSTFELQSISNWDNVDEPLGVEGTLKITGLATAMGRRILLPTMPFQTPEFRAFVPEKRENMIYFHYPYEELDEAKVRAPAGYKIETVPPAGKLNPGRMSYSIVTTQESETIAVKRHLIVDGILFPVRAYPTLRTFFGNVKSNDEAQIVFQSPDVAKSN
jgi:transglutaminase-like putative cysteine protease